MSRRRAEDYSCVFSEDLHTRPVANKTIINNEQCNTVIALPQCKSNLKYYRDVEMSCDVFMCSYICLCIKLCLCIFIFYNIRKFPGKDLSCSLHVDYLK